MLKYLRILIAVVLVSLLILSVVPVYALDSSPSTLQVNNVYCYQSLLESGDMAFMADFAVKYEGTLTDDTGTALGSPVTLGIGLNTINVVGLGKFNIALPSGLSGTATSGTCTVSSSPKPLIAGTTSITTSTATGTIYVYLSNSMSSLQTITDAYSVRLMSGTTEIRSASPYAFYNQGFSRGITWMYFTAAQVTAASLTWRGTYTMRLDGNPTISWTGTGSFPPSATPYTSFSWRDSTTTGQTQLLLTSDIRLMAQILTNDWNNTSYILFTTSSPGGIKLTNAGQAYFSANIPNLDLLAPDVLLAVQTGMSLITPMSTPNKYANEIGNDFQGTKYETGTATFTNGSTAVTGVTTAWDGTMIGGLIKLNADNAFYTISAVPAVNSITLSTTYIATGGSGAYTIYYLANPPTGATNGALPPLSLFPAADALHMPVMVVGIIICAGIILFVMAHGCGAANSYRPAILIVLPLLYMFTRLGFFPMGLTIGLGLFGAFAIWYTFFYEKSNV
jgi:hypothetical protein